MQNRTKRISRLVLALTIACCWLGVTSFSQAQDEASRPTRKLGRGVSNFFLGFLEIPRAWKDVKQEHGDVAGLTWGTFLGVKRTAMRMGVGTYEVLTFPYDNGPILYPEFVVGQREEDVWAVETRDAY